MLPVTPSSKSLEEGCVHYMDEAAIVQYVYK